MRRSLSLRGLSMVALAWIVSGCALTEQVRDLVRPPTPTPSVVRTQGHICDAITGLPVSGAQLRAASILESLGRLEEASSHYRKALRFLEGGEGVFGDLASEAAEGLGRTGG